MAVKVMAAVQVAPQQTEMREFELPDIADDAGLLRVEAAGVCGSDVSAYKRMKGGARILGHENVGTIAKVGRVAAARWGVKEGDRVALEEYLPCGHCEWCLIGEPRHCFATDQVSNPQALRYGSTPVDVTPRLWGGYSQYLYMPPNTVLHKMPEHVPAEQAAMALPLGNGIQWAHVEGGASLGTSILVMGPGQQGLACVIAAKSVGSTRVIISGLTRDAARLDVAKQLGADDVIDVEKEDLLERVRGITGGEGVDAAVDTTSSTSPVTTLQMIEAVKRKDGRIVVQGQGETLPDFPLGRLSRKYITLKPARGHSYHSVELAIKLIGSGRYPLHLLTTHTFGLQAVDTAIRATGGEGTPGAIHVTVTPWAA